MSLAIEAARSAPSAGGRLPPYPGLESGAQDDLQSCTDLSDAAIDAAELPPLLPGLPHTPYSRCAALICAIVWQGIVERDVHWCRGPTFDWYLSLLGFDSDTIRAIRRRVLADQFAFVRWTNGNWLNGLPMGLTDEHA
jgi:hypothetical protein